MTQLAVFDWNGTLLSDEQIAYECNSLTCRYFGKPEMEFEAWRDIYTIPIIDIYLQRGFTREEFLEHSAFITEMFHEAYERAAESATLREGARQLLEYLVSSGVPCVILSNHTAGGIRSQLERKGISPLIETVLASEEKDDAGQERRKYLRLQEYLQDKGIDAARAVIIGDTDEEVEIGKSLGMKTVTVSGGFQSERKLRLAQPDFLVGSLSEVVGVL